MKLINKLAVAVALFAVVAGAYAQGGRRGGGFQMNPYMLLRSKDVQTDLKMTDDQVKKVTDIQTKEQEEVRSNMQNSQASGSFDPAAMQATMKKMNDEYNPQINAVLTPDQQTRLHQIFVQWRKNQAILDPDVQGALGISSDQKAQITDLQSKRDEANNALREKQRSGELTREDATTIRTKNDATFEDQLAKLLTPDQAAKLKDMGGAPFTGKIEMGFGGGGRRGPGGRGGAGGGGGGGGIG
jgi:periplasmic protein CpxP/Spy